MMVFKSEPSGFADNTRPAPTSRKNNRPDVLGLSAAFSLEVIVLIRNLLLVLQCDFDRNALEPNLRARSLCRYRFFSMFPVRHLHIGICNTKTGQAANPCRMRSFGTDDLSELVSRVAIG